MAWVCGEWWELSLGSVVSYGVGQAAWGLAAAFGVGLVSGWGGGRLGAGSGV